MRRRLRATMTLLAATAAVLVAPSAPAQATPAQMWGFAYVDQPGNSAWHNVLPTHQAGSWPAGTVVGRKVSTGHFQVKFPVGVTGTRGIPHVTAVGPNSGGTPNYCHVMKWQDGLIDVSCTRPGGLFPDDTRFTVMWTLGTGTVVDGRAHAYVAHNFNGQCYNSVPGGTCTVGGTNPYFLRFTGVGDPAALAGNLQVTAVYPESSPRHCKVMTWGGTTDVSAYIRCYDAFGNVPPNTPFVASYNRNRSVYGGVNRHFGYQWCVNGAAAAGLTKFNVLGFNNTCTQTAIGRYQTVFPSLAVSAAGPTHAQVTAQGPQDSDYCNITQLWPLGPDGRPQVDCYTNAGVRSNENFLIAFTGAH